MGESSYWNLSDQQVGTGAVTDGSSFQQAKIILDAGNQSDANGFSTGHTLTEVQVNKVFENKSGNENGQSINVLEPTYIAEGEEGPTRFNYDKYLRIEVVLR